jgi:hypothetical protein
MTTCKSPLGDVGRHWSKWVSGKMEPQPHRAGLGSGDDNGVNEHGATGRELPKKKAEMASIGRRRRNNIGPMQQLPHAVQRRTQSRCPRG